MGKVQKIIYRDEHVALVHPIPSGIPYWNFWERKDKPDYVIVIDRNRIVGVYYKVQVVKNLIWAERYFPFSRYWDRYERIPQD